MTPLGVAQLWRNFLGNFPFKIGFFGIAKKIGRMGVGGGPSVKRKHGVYGVAPGKTAGTGSPAPLVPVSCRYLLVSCCSFFFPSQKEQILARFGEAVKPACVWPIGRGWWALLLPFLSSLVRQPCCIVLEWYLVHVLSYGGIIWPKHEEMETNFN